MAQTKSNQTMHSFKWLSVIIRYKIWQNINTETIATSLFANQAKLSTHLITIVHTNTIDKQAYVLHCMLFSTSKIIHKNRSILRVWKQSIVTKQWVTQDKNSQQSYWISIVLQQCNKTYWFVKEWKKHLLIHLIQGNEAKWRRKVI